MSQHHYWYIWICFNKHKPCCLMPIVHQSMAASSGVRCISTLIVNCKLHYNDAFRQILQEPRWCSASQLLAVHNVSSLMLTFVNWYILCGEVWMCVTMLLFALFYVLIFLPYHQFLEDGVSLFFLFFLFLITTVFFVFLLYYLYIHCGSKKKRANFGGL